MIKFTPDEWVTISDALLEFAHDLRENYSTRSYCLKLADQASEIHQRIQEEIFGEDPGLEA